MPHPIPINSRMIYLMQRWKIIKWVTKSDISGFLNNSDINSSISHTSRIKNRATWNKKLQTYHSSPFVSYFANDGSQSVLVELIHSLPLQWSGCNSSCFTIKAAS